MFCRASIKSYADSKLINGWVRNLFNGKVQAVVDWSGYESEKASFESFLRQGPGRSVVERVEELDFVSIEKYNGFEIRPDGNYEAD